MSDIDFNVTEEALEFDITATGPKGDEGEINPDNYDAKGSIVDNDKITGFDSQDSDNSVTWLWSVIKSTFATYYNSLIATLTNKTINTKEQDLGNITGAVEIDFTQGQHVVANPTGELTLTSAGGAETDHILDFDLYFTAIQTINWPANTIFSDGAAPDPSTAPYRVVGSVDENNVLTIDGVIEVYATL